MTEGRGLGTAKRARRFLLLLAALLSLLTIASLWLDLRDIDARYRRLAGEMGRSFFEAVDTVRQWNFAHGGLYVPSSSGITPNPYLPADIREATTTGGGKLTLVTHAHMTRLLSRLLSTRHGIRLHISSRTPISPANRPDEWEQIALDRFQRGEREVYGLAHEGEGGTFRYIAPLRMGPACLPCHRNEPYSDGEIRGGISVSFPYAPFLTVMASERRSVILVHGMFFFGGLALIALTGSRLLENIDALQVSLARIKTLEGFVPICAQCKKIRLEGADRKRQDSWVEFERYIQDRTDAEFTHGLCPRCARELYPTVFASEQH